MNRRIGRRTIISKMKIPKLSKYDVLTGTEQVKYNVKYIFFDNSAANG